jgi:hypothetical protein
MKYQTRGRVAGSQTVIGSSPLSSICKALCDNELRKVILLSRFVKTLGATPVLLFWAITIKKNSDSMPFRWKPKRRKNKKQSMQQKNTLVDFRIALPQRIRKFVQR